MDNLIFQIVKSKSFKKDFKKLSNEHNPYADGYKKVLRRRLYD